MTLPPEGLFLFDLERERDLDDLMKWVSAFNSSVVASVSRLVRSVPHRMFDVLGLMPHRVRERHLSQWALWNKHVRLRVTRGAIAF